MHPQIRKLVIIAHNTQCKGTRRLALLGKFQQGYNTADEAAGLAKTLREQMDASIAGPEYSTARELRRSHYRREDAIDIGEELAGGRISASLPKKAAKVAPENKGLLGQSYAVKQSENLLNRNSTEGALGRLSTPLGKEASDAALPQTVVNACGQERKEGAKYGH